MTFQTIITYFPELYIFCCTFFFLHFGTLFYSENQKFYRPNKLNIFLSFDIIINSLFLIIVFFFNNKSFFRIEYSLFIEILLLFFLSLIIITTYSYNKYNKIASFEYLIFILFSTSSLLFLLNSTNLILFYLLLELQGIAFYILASLKKKSKYSIESGLKYFILGSTSSIILLFGISIFYSFTGLLSFFDISFFLKNIFYINDYILQSILSISIIFIMIGMLFKIYCAPFHYWVPDIYQGSPTSTVFFFSILPFLTNLILFFNLFFIYFIDFFIIYKYFIYIGSVFSMIFGSLGALIQKKIKKLLAFSTVYIIGNILMVLNVYDMFSLINILFFIIIYLINSISFFIVIINVFFFNNKNLENLFYFTSISKINKYLSFFISIILFSFSGIPPLLGFFSKYYFYNSLIEHNNFFLLLITVITSVLSTFYYLRIIKIMYYSSNDRIFFFKPIKYYISLLIILLVFFNIFFIINPSLIINIISNAIISNYNSFIK